MPIDIKRPESISEDDPLWQYYQQMKASESSQYSPEDREYRKSMAESYRDQDFMNQLIPAISKAGAGFGSVGGVAPKSSMADYKFTPAATRDSNQEIYSNNDSSKRDMLYQNLMSGLSNKIAAKDKATIDQEKFNQSLELKKQEGEASRGQKQKMFDQTADLKKDIFDKNADLKKDINTIAKPPNEVQGAFAVFGKQMMDANALAEKAIADGYDPGSMMAAARKNSTTYPLTANQEDRKFETAKRAWIGAYLRKTSGAAISDSEFEKENAKFFPQVGDGPEVVQTKKSMREAAAENFMKLAGPSSEGMKSATGPKAPEKKTVVKKQHNKAQNKTKLIYSDGSEEVIDGLQ